MLQSVQGSGRSLLLRLLATLVSWGQGTAACVSCLEDPCLSWEPRAQHPWVGLRVRKALTHSRKHVLWIEALLWLPTKVLPCSFLPIRVAFMSSHFHSQEREGGRESEEGGRRGESSSGHFYLTPTKVLGKGNAKGLAIFMGRKRETLDQNMLMFQ